MKTLKSSFSADGRSDRMSSIRAVIHFLAPHHAALRGVVLFSAVANLLMLTAPVFMLQVYDRVLASNSIPTLVTLFVLVTFLYIAQSLIDFARGRVLARIGEDFDRQTSKRIFICDLDRAIQSNTDERSPLIDLARLRRFMSSTGPLALLDTPWVPVYLLILALLHWTLGLLGLAGAAVVIVLAIVGDRSTRSDLQAAGQLDAEAQRLQATGTRTAEIVRVLGMNEALARDYADVRRAGISAESRSGDATARLASASKGFRMFLQSATLAAGAVLAIQQQVSAGVMIAASIILGRALAPIDQIVGQWRSIAQARDALERVAALLTTDSRTVTPVRLPRPSGRLAVTALAACPPGSRRLALAGVTFNLGPGDGLGIIGPSGAGKSTLARALVGVTKPAAGEIRLDGATLDQWDPTLLGPHIGYLPQNMELFGRTVRDCISRLDPDASDENIIRAAMAAGAHEMILQLPDGYLTPIGEGGAALSGGQSQRIGLARALHGDPALIVLDEPNANLDQEGDAALTRAIHEARNRGAVVVTVTHRPSAIAGVNLLLLMKGGKQVWFGRRESILRRLMKPSAISSVGTHEVPA